MTTIEIVESVALGAIVIGFAVYFFIRGLRDHWISKIYDTIKAEVRTAEKLHGDGQGKEKMKYVLDFVAKKCKERGVPFSLITGLVKKTVERLVEGYNSIVK